MFHLFFLMYFIVIFCSIFEVKEFDKKQPGYYRLAILLLPLFFLVVFGGWRNLGFGNDDFNYIYYFYQFNSTGIFPDNLDVGFKVLMFLTSIFTSDVHYLFALVILLSFSCYFFGIYKKSLFVSISVVILMSHSYWFRELNQIRAAVSYGIIFLLFIRYYDIGLIHRLVLLVLAFSFHFTAVLAIIPIFLSYFKFNKKFSIILVVIAVFLGPYLSAAMFEFLNLIPLGDVLVSKIYKYILDTEGYAVVLSVVNPTSLKYLAIFLAVCFCFEESDINSSKEIRLLVFTIFCAVLWIFFFRSYAVFASRIASMFFVTEVIVIPILINRLIKKGASFIIILFVLSIYGLTLLLNLLSRDAYDIYNFALF